MTATTDGQPPQLVLMTATSIIPVTTTTCLLPLAVGDNNDDQPSTQLLAT